MREGTQDVRRTLVTEQTRFRQQLIRHCGQPELHAISLLLVALPFLKAYLRAFLQARCDSCGVSARGDSDRGG